MVLDLLLQYHKEYVHKNLVFVFDEIFEYGTTLMFSKTPLKHFYFIFIDCTLYHN